MEKAYRAWGRELTTDDTPLEAGLGFAVRFDKEAPFMGREALLAQRARPLGKRLVSFVLDDPEALPWGDEPCTSAPITSVCAAAPWPWAMSGGPKAWTRRISRRRASRSRSAASASPRAAA